MRISHKVFVNADDALIVWTADVLDDGLRGFAIERKRNGGAPGYISSYTPFGPAAHQNGEFQRSDEWPFRAFSWTDHEVDTGDRVSYRVVPVYWDGGAKPSRGTRWSAERVATSSDPRSPYTPFFNRGFVASQFVSRHLDAAFPDMTRTAALRAFKASISDETEVEWRGKLAGQLRVEMLRLLDAVATGKGQIFAALYELDDDELIGRLERLGSRAHVVLSNGSVKKDGTPRASVHFTKAPKRVDLTALAEIVEGAETGLMFLLFNAGKAGVIPPIQRLAEAKPDVLIRGVATELPQPEKPKGSKAKLPLKMTLFGDPAAPKPTTRTFDVVMPTGHEHTAAKWAVESSRGELKGGIGPAIVHSKVLVVDPFSKDPIVVTGSHNFSSNASTQNDENFVVIRGDRALAEAYTVHVQSAWRHYASRIGTAHPKAKGAEYLQLLLDDRRREAPFWGLG